MLLVQRFSCTENGNSGKYCNHSNSGHYVMFVYETLIFATTVPTLDLIDHCFQALLPG
jgi:hypothetical protein